MESFLLKYICLQEKNMSVKMMSKQLCPGLIWM